MIFLTALKTLIFDEVMSAFFGGVSNNFRKMDGLILGKDLRRGMHLSKIELAGIGNVYYDCEILDIRVFTSLNIVSLVFSYSHANIPIKHSTKQINKYYNQNDFYSDMNTDRYYL